MRTICNILSAVLPLIMLLPTVSSCRKVEIDSIEKKQFLTYSEIGFYPSGEPHFIYDESLHQMCVNSSRGQFRIQTNSQDTCMNIVLKSYPHQGEMVLSQLDYFDSSLKSSDECELECSKKTDGKMWLWDGYTKTGLIISQY